MTRKARDKIAAGLHEAIAVARADMIKRLTAERDALLAENFSLAADQCHYGYGDEGGSHRCKYQDQLANLARDAKAEIERLTAENAELVSALREARSWLHGDWGDGPSVMTRINAVLSEKVE